MFRSPCLPPIPLLRLLLGCLLILTLAIVVASRCDAGDSAVQKGWIGDWVPARQPAAPTLAPVPAPAPVPLPASVTTPVVTSTARHDGRRLMCPAESVRSVTVDVFHLTGSPGPSAVDVEVITGGAKETRTINRRVPAPIVHPPRKKFRVFAVDGEQAAGRDVPTNGAEGTAEGPGVTP